jgi:hypothetical protein
VNTIKKERINTNQQHKKGEMDWSIIEVDWSIIDIDWRKEYETMERIYNEWTNPTKSNEFND